MSNFVLNLLCIGIFTQIFHDFVYKKHLANINLIVYTKKTQLSNLGFGAIHNYANPLDVDFFSGYKLLN